MLSSLYKYHTNSIFQISKILLIKKSVNCIKTLANGTSPREALNKQDTNHISTCLFNNHFRSPNVLIQLTHSMLPLSLLILACYTCNIYRVSLLSIASYQMHMSRDNGSFKRIGNRECTSTSSTPSHDIAYANRESITKSEMMSVMRW